MTDTQRLTRTYALQLLATAVRECRKSGLTVTTHSDSSGLTIKVKSAYILRDSDETFVLAEDSDDL